MLATSLTIAKEQVGNLPFTPGEVFECKQEKAKRNYNLNRAVLLGNLYQHKVDIEYQLFTGTRQRVYTTVWAICPEFVILKGGRSIPIKSITNIHLI
jgi:hypothetical protein